MSNAVAPTILSCRSLGASVTASQFSAVTSLAPYGAPLEDGGGAGDLGPGSSSIFLRSLLSIFTIFPYSRYLTAFALFPFSGTSPPSIYLVKTFW